MKSSDTDSQHSVLGQEFEEQLLEAIAPIEPPRNLRAHVLNRVFSVQKSSLEQAFTIRKKESWKELSPGIEYKVLLVDTAAQTKSFLLRAKAGVCMPAHDHHGYEECLVLEGSFKIGDLTLQAGDFHCATQTTHHAESSTDTGVLVYLKAAIDDYPEVQL